MRYLTVVLNLALVLQGYIGVDSARGTAFYQPLEVESPTFSHWRYVKQEVACTSDYFPEVKQKLQTFRSDPRFATYRKDPLRLYIADPFYVGNSPEVTKSLKEYRDIDQKNLRNAAENLGMFLISDRRERADYSLEVTMTVNFPSFWVISIRLYSSGGKFTNQYTGPICSGKDWGPWILVASDLLMEASGDMIKNR